MVIRHSVPDSDPNSEWRTMTQQWVADSDPTVSTGEWPDSQYRTVTRQSVTRQSVPDSDPTVSDPTVSTGQWPDSQCRTVTRQSVLGSDLTVSAGQWADSQCRTVTRPSVPDSDPTVVTGQWPDSQCRTVNRQSVPGSDPTVSAGQWPDSQCWTVTQRCLLAASWLWLTRLYGKKDENQYIHKISGLPHMTRVRMFALRKVQLYIFYPCGFHFDSHRWPSILINSLTNSNTDSFSALSHLGLKLPPPWIQQASKQLETERIQIATHLKLVSLWLILWANRNSALNVIQTFFLSGSPHLTSSYIRADKADLRGVTNI